MEFTWEHFGWALILGGVSAASLPLGSWLGLVLKPRDRIVGAMAGFGGGALIAALTIELVAPTIFELGKDPHAVGHFWSLMIGALVGGSLFVILDQIVNAKGGFLRKSAYTMSHFTQRRQRRYEHILKSLCSVRILQGLPAEAANDLVRLVKPRQFNAEEHLFEQGDKGTVMYFITKGEVELLDHGNSFKSLGADEVLGEIALVSGARRTVAAVAKSVVEVLELRKEDFENLRSSWPQFDKYVRDTASERLSELKVVHAKEAEAEKQWTEKASEALKMGTQVPTQSDLRAMHAAHGGAPLAIWLGIMLDGIPESFVIGTGLMAILHAHAEAGTSVAFMAVVPWTLLAGLFLSNFPEALSSSVGMEEQGMKRPKILWLWSSLAILTALGAGLGYYAGESLTHSTLIAVEGLAAGAMLTMIGAAMLPEAVHRAGGNLAGFSALLGFIVALLFKLLE